MASRSKSLFRVMRQFKEFVVSYANDLLKGFQSLNKSALKTASELNHLLSGKGRVISPKTLKIDAHTVGDVTVLLRKRGYTRSFADKDSMVYRLGQSVVGLNYDQGRMYATVVID